MAETQSSYNPSLSGGSTRIELSITRRQGDLSQQQNTYLANLSSINRVLMDQEFDIRVSVLPSDKSIFEKNPVLFLFRETNRSRRNQGFRNSGKKFVHPSHYLNGIKNQRYRGGSHTNPYAILDRITEVPLNINTHSVTGAHEFYGGSDINPDGTSFLFRPLARFSNSADISGNSVRFPQPLHQLNIGTYDSGVGISSASVQDNVGTGIFQFFYTGKGRGRNQTQRYKFGIMLMVDNPDYQGPGDTQNAPKIVASNMAMFELGYQRANLIDDVTSEIGKYVIDWRVLPFGS